MSLTLDEKYKSASIDIDWLFHLTNSNSDIMYLAGHDQIVSSNQYYGIIQDSGTISRELDLLNSKASVSDVTITCANVFKNDTLAAELFHGTYKYLNQKVLIYENPNDQTDIANCHLLYEGRLKYITHTIDTCTLTFEQWTPFDHITVPSVKSTTEQVYTPVVYGLFDGNNPDVLCDNTNLYPIPRIIDEGYKRYFSMPKAVVSTDEVFPHYYDKRNKVFEPIGLVTDGQVTASKDGVNSVYATAVVTRKFQIYPDAVHEDADWPTNPTYGFNKNTGNYAQTTDYEHSVSGNYDEELVLALPAIEGEITSFKVHIKADINLHTDNGADTPYGLFLAIVQTGGVNTFLEVENEENTDATSGYEEIDATAGLTDTKMPEKLRIRCRWQMDTDTSSIEGWARVDDCYIEVTSYLFVADTDPTYGTIFSNIDTVYMGDTDGTGAGDGLDMDYTDGAGTPVVEIHQAFRDIMDRYAGVDYDNDYMINWIAASPGAYDLDAARDGWNVRFWMLEPTEIKDVLDQLQFEGCFIFFLVANSDGSGNAGGRFVWVHDTYASGDVVFTFDEKDYKGLQIYHSDFSDIVTKTIYNYDKHPATGEYRKTESYDNTTDRDNWNLGTLHFEEINLDYLANCGDNLQATSLLAEALDDSETGVDVDDGTEFSAGDYILVDSEIMLISEISTNTLTVIRGSMGTTAAAHDDNKQVYLHASGDIYDTGSPDADNLPNESIVLYYDNIKSEPKVMVRFDIINPDGKQVELGDIIQLNDTSIDPFGETWSNIYFMIVEEHREKFNINVVGREVYRT